MTDLARWKVHGPVKTLRSEFAEWDLERHEWQPVQRFNVASFRADGAILTVDAHNPNGTIAHSLILYDDAGRMVESHSWMNDGPIDRTVYVYDEDGRPTRTTHLEQDGTQKEIEVCSYDAAGKKTKVRFLTHHEDLECNATHGCGASIAYSIEDTDSAYGAPGAATMTVTYDENDLPTKVSFHDSDQHLIRCVTLIRDRAGRLLSEEMHEGDRSPFQNHLDKAPPEKRERLAALLEVALGGMASNKTYRYDTKGRLVAREHRMGNLGGDTTTYHYEDSDDPVAETTEHRTRDASFDDETDNVSYSSDRQNVQHNRLEYLYDAHGNWIERIVSFRSESSPDFQRSNIERRTISYYSA